MNPDIRNNLNNVYDKCLKNNIEELGKESKEIQMVIKMQLLRITIRHTET